MKRNIIELQNIPDIKKSIDFVFTSFFQTEKNFYSYSELKDATRSLINFDVFNVNELSKLISKRVVKLLACTGEAERLLGVCAFEPKSGKILFLAIQENKHTHLILNDLIERITEERVSEPDGVLNIMAFIGQEKMLIKIGFKRIVDSVIYYNNLKLVPMRYAYFQIDIEK